MKKYLSLVIITMLVSCDLSDLKLTLVNPKGQKSNQFLEDLKRINGLRGIKINQLS